MENFQLYENRILPTVALRGLVMFPNMQLHFDVGREKTLSAIKNSANSDNLIFMVAQKDEISDEISPNNLYKIGVVAKIKQVINTKNNTAKVIAEGVYRARAVKYTLGESFLYSEIEELPFEGISALSDSQIKAYLRLLTESFEQITSLVKRMPKEIVNTVSKCKDPLFLAEFIASNVLTDPKDKQSFLEEYSAEKRISLIISMLKKEIDIISIELNINEKVQKQLDKNQREYFLREQLHQIQSELELHSNNDSEEEDYIKKIKALNLKKEIEERLLKEANRINKLPDSSQETALIKNYLDTCLELPWNEQTKEIFDISRARKVLDKDHFGMEKVKERILEFLAVKQLQGDASSQIICLVGPPGVGKTSIVRSISKATNRNYERIALGGVRDESDIRGHRRTYVASMPGRIIQSLIHAKSNNPIILLDEVDKLGNDFRGDPSSALLEVLDPEQNCTFTDHYINLPFDLSKVMFFTTANSLSDIPGPLYDRMEIIELYTYSRDEKFNIAKKHLIKKQITKNGLDSKKIRISDSAIYAMIDGYTRESGVRSLERIIAKLCRKVALMILEKEDKLYSVTAKNIEDFLGKEKYQKETAEEKPQIGVVTGLAWTAVGGETMQIEVSALKGSGKIELTGSLGDVMKESAKTSITCVRSIAEKYDINPDFYKDLDIHIHVPEGAVPKDGPSAGVAMTTALVSALSKRAVNPKIAMTGEITLRGRVLPIGGLKEKSMAAYSNGIKTIIIPKKNEKDIEEISTVVKDNVNIITVEEISQILEIALMPK